MAGTTTVHTRSNRFVSNAKTGNFTVNQQARHDGRNWVRISQFARIRGGEETESAAQASSEGYKPTDFQEQAKDEGKETLHRESLRNRLSRAHRIIDCGVGYYLLDEGGTPVVTKEDIFTLSSDQIVEVYDGDTFKIDLPGMHALFGDNLSIRVLGIDTPEMKGTSDQIKALAAQAREITEKALLGGRRSNYAMLSVANISAWLRRCGSTVNPLPIRSRQRDWQRTMMGKVRGRSGEGESFKFFIKLISLGSLTEFLNYRQRLDLRC